MESTLKILFVSSEAVPYAKSGGLADVAGSLPQALTEADMDVRIIMPLYPSTKKVMLDKTPAIEKIAVPLGDLQLPASVYMTRSTKRVQAFFVHREDLFTRPGLYGSSAGDYYDNLERFTFFCHAVLMIAQELDFRPDIIHCHDWQTGLIPALLKGPYNEPFFKGTSTLFTIHNMGYQGVFPGQKLNITGLKGIDFYHQEGLEYWGNISLLKSGIVYADAVTTVSPTYAEEIRTREFGLGMEGILINRKNSLSGILNGVDYEVWDPEKDKHITKNYSLKNLTGKNLCKKELIKEMGLDPSLFEKPIFGMVSRLDKQKGLDLLLDILDRLMALDTGLVILGSGDSGIEKALTEASKKHPGKIGIGTGFNDPLAHRILAGSNIFLIPSRYEPCGLTQMYALKYGTVPVVRATGGLNDTVSSYEKGMGNGFKFEGSTPEEFLSCIAKAIELYKSKTEWKRIVTNGMKEDFSWKKSGDKYIELYRKLKEQSS
ncbi:MAG: glycogen synthase GlgA [Methanosarcina sp.]|nr:glycogen synthase GlgA [Methanosarcina sp.]